LIALGSQKPPLHIPPDQAEYIQVLEGYLAVEVEGKELLLHSGSGELCVRPWQNHRLYPPPRCDNSTQDDDDDAGKLSMVTRFLLSGEESPRAFRLDTIFFENWYAYQDLVMIHGARLNMLQVMCVSIVQHLPISIPYRTQQMPNHYQMFDAGASYLSLPWWVPFGRSIALSMGVVLGRWLAGSLGYQPYYRKWTTDWQLACEKMEKSIFYRRFAQYAKNE
jgi:hypothetical protein